MVFPSYISCPGCPLLRVEQCELVPAPSPACTFPGPGQPACTSSFPMTRAALWMQVDGPALSVDLLWGPRGFWGWLWTAALPQGTLRQAQAVASFRCCLGLCHLFAFFTLCHLPPKELDCTPPSLPGHPSVREGAQSCTDVLRALCLPTAPPVWNEPPASTHRCFLCAFLFPFF